MKRHFGVMALVVCAVAMVSAEVRATDRSPDSLIFRFKVIVQTKSGEEMAGELYRIRQDTLGVWNRSAGLSRVATSDVQSIYRIRNHAGVGAVCGLLIGTVVGVAVAPSIDSRSGSGADKAGKGVAVLGAAILGGTFGAIMGAMQFSVDRNRPIMLDSEMRSFGRAPMSYGMQFCVLKF